MVQTSFGPPAKPEKSLEEILVGAKKGAVDFLEKHGGKVVISVTLGNRLWKAGVRAIGLDDGTVVPIDDAGEGITFVDITGVDPDFPMTDRLLHYHHPNDWADHEDEDVWDEYPDDDGDD